MEPQVLLRHDVGDLRRSGRSRPCWWSRPARPRGTACARPRGRRRASLAQRVDVHPGSGVHATDADVRAGTRRSRPPSRWTRAPAFGDVQGAREEVLGAASRLARRDQRRQVRHRAAGGEDPARVTLYPNSARRASGSRCSRSGRRPLRPHMFTNRLIPVARKSPSADASAARRRDEREEARTRSCCRSWPRSGPVSMKLVSSPGPAGGAVPDRPGGLERALDVGERPPRPGTARTRSGTRARPRPSRASAPDRVRGCGIAPMLRNAGGDRRCATRSR